MSKPFDAMASPPSPCVGIFDDFDDAKVMDSAYCSQVSEDQFQEDIRSETDKALGELCLYLDGNPEIYARVLRKRKQEEMEGQGVVSYMKSKMMSFLHGEQYPQCLVSTSDCIQQTNALKAGMCKTFQYSQDLKGNATRHSERLAAKSQGKYSNKGNTDDKTVKASASSSGTTTVGNQSKSDPPVASRADQKSSHLPDKSFSLISESAAGNGNDTGLKLSCLQSKDEIYNQQCTTNLEADPGTKLTNRVETIFQQIEVQGNKSETFPSVPPPPPPPPLPANLVSSVLSSKPSKRTAEVSKTTPRLNKALTIITNTTSSVRIDGKTPVVVMEDLSKSLGCNSRQRTPNIGPGSGSSRENSLKRSRSERKLLPSSRPDLRASMDGVFLTPMVTKRMKFHKRSHSNSSISSASSYESIHSELIASNPLTRLKATQIARSPGGTPVRTKSRDRLPSEPLHKALVTAMRSKFKNVETPSPRSGNASHNTSNTSAFNSTFSP